MPSVTNATDSLSSRIRELRRRHYGPRGAARFAELLGVPVEDFVRFERGAVPPGELLVRMCECTGEDLQWLLTGVAARGSVVIAGARHRHQQLLTRLATLLEECPHLATPVESFLELLSADKSVRTGSGSAAHGSTSLLIPIVSLDHFLEHPSPPRDAADRRQLVTTRNEIVSSAEPRRVRIDQPTAERPSDGGRNAELLVVPGPSEASVAYLEDDALSDDHPDAIGVWLTDDRFEPLFAGGDAAILDCGAAPRAGNVVLCCVRGEPQPRCRIWLTERDGAVTLGAVGDGSLEHVQRSSLLWLFPIMARLRPAA